MKRMEPLRSVFGRSVSEDAADLSQGLLLGWRLRGGNLGLLRAERMRGEDRRQEEAGRETEWAEVHLRGRMTF